jgi:hypothetical protein
VHHSTGNPHAAHGTKLVARSRPCGQTRAGLGAQ